MPRISDARREANRSAIVAAARRCFARDGFHQTSMPDIAAEAGVSVGAPYRYFASKEQIIVEIAGDAFRMIFDPVERLVDADRVASVGDLITSAMDPISGEVTLDRSGREVQVEESLRCAVQAWAELLRHDGLRRQAFAGFSDVRDHIAEALRRGQRAGLVPAALDPDGGARLVMAVLHGFVLQRVAFGLDDVTGFAADVRTMFAASVPSRRATSRGR